jgi:hypothetical protein
MESVERYAQHCFARLVAQGSGPMTAGAATSSSAPASPASSPPVFVELDPDSLELTQPRSIGVEHVALAAMRELAFEPLLESMGINGVMRTAIVGSIIARMAAPGSELASHRWLTGTSGLGDLLEVDLAALPLSRLYRASDLLMKHREVIESSLFARIETVFALEASVTLYDLTNTYFEGSATANPKAARGRSKEKRSDCPLVTLGVVCDGAGVCRQCGRVPHAGADADQPGGAGRGDGDHGSGDCHGGKSGLAGRPRVSLSGGQPRAGSAV